MSWSRAKRRAYNREYMAARRRRIGADRGTSWQQIVEKYLGINRWRYVRREK